MIVNACYNKAYSLTPLSMSRESAAPRVQDEPDNGLMIEPKPETKSSVPDQKAAFKFGNLYMHLKEIFATMEPFTATVLIQEEETESLHTIQTQKDGRAFIIEGNKRRELNEDNDLIFFSQELIDQLQYDNYDEIDLKSQLPTLHSATTIISPPQISARIKALIEAETGIEPEIIPDTTPLKLKSSGPAPKGDFALPALDEDDTWNGDVTGVRTKKT